LKLSELVAGFRALTVAEETAAGASVLPGAAGAVLRGGPEAAKVAAARAGRFGLRGTGAQVLGSALGTIAFGVGFALSSRGESGKVTHLGGPLDVEIDALPGGSGAYIRYVDPVDGKKRYFGPVKNDTNVADAILADIKKHHPGFSTGGTGQTGSQSIDQARAEHAAQQRRAGTTTPAATAAARTRRRRRERFTDIIPQSLTGAVLDAQLAGDTGAERRAIQAEQRFLEHELTLATTEAERNDIKQQLLGLKGDASGLDKGASAASRSHAAALRRRANAAARRERGRFSTRESGFRAAELHAEATKGTADDVRAYKREDTFLRLYSSDRSHAQRLRDRADVRRATIEKHLAKLVKNSDDAKALTRKTFQALQSEFLSEFNNIVGQYAPNVTGGSTPLVLNNHQHFNAPTTDRHREARYSLIAMRSAFAA
jgi:hypothetical protein